MSSFPVVSLLSPNPVASRRAQKLLCELFRMDPLSYSSPLEDTLNRLFASNIPGFSRQWDSVACQSPSAVIHILSMDSDRDNPGPLSLLGITTSYANDNAIFRARNELSNHMSGQVNRIRLFHATGNRLSVARVLGHTTDLPVLDLPCSEEEEEPATASAVGLKEIVLPACSDSKYPDGSCLLSQLSGSSLARPKIGLYQWPGAGVCLRPLPAAEADMALSPPTLVFQSDSLEQADDHIHKAGAASAKIGFGGTGNGQLLVRHKDFCGLDLRFCAKEGYESRFSEAQESLMAGSLGVLQSTNVLNDGSGAGKPDEKIGVADCWSEFRANVKRPQGFWNQKRRTTVKAPDIPYE